VKSSACWAAGPRTWHLPQVCSLHAALISRDSGKVSSSSSRPLAVYTVVTVLDLVLSTEPELVEDVEMGCPIANNNHYTILFSIPMKSIVFKCNKNERYYNKANYEECCRQLESVQWDNIVDRKDVEQEWYVIKGQLLRCMHELVPKN